MRYLAQNSLYSAGYQPKSCIRDGCFRSVAAMNGRENCVWGGNAQH